MKKNILKNQCMILYKQTQKLFIILKLFNYTIIDFFNLTKKNYFFLSHLLYVFLKYNI